jgi:hypothetical protein
LTFGSKPAAPAEPHAHLDKALSADQFTIRARDLGAAIQARHPYRRTLGVHDIAQRPEAAARMARARGVTALRTHVDVGEGIELRAVEALLDVRQRLRSVMQIRVVALGFALAGQAGAENLALVRAALELGVDVVGGAPHIDADPVGHLEACLGLAAEFERPVRHQPPPARPGRTHCDATRPCPDRDAPGGRRARRRARRQRSRRVPSAGVRRPASDCRGAGPGGAAGAPDAYRLVSENARAVMGLERNTIAPGATADPSPCVGPRSGRYSPAKSPSARPSSALTPPVLQPDVSMIPSAER